MAAWPRGWSADFTTTMIVIA